VGINRRRFLIGAAGVTGVAVGTPWLGAAPAATDDELAYANFGLAAAYLAADYYARALDAGKLAGAGRTLRSGRAASLAHARALTDLISGAGDTPAAAEDFEFAWPDNAYATAASTRKTGFAVLRPTLAAYQSAAASVIMPSYRVLYSSLAASLGQQIGALVGPTGERAEPFPPALDLESASGALETYLG
jgi:ferritin-like protein